MFGEKKLIGLDIGSSTIKMAELNVQRGNAQLVSFGYLPTPQGVVGAGEINNVSSVAEAVIALSHQIKTSRKYVSLGMWGTSVIVKKITIPKIEKKLMDQQIRWEAEQYIPFDPAEISLSFHVINLPGGGDTMEVLLVAAQNAMVRQFNQLVDEAQLKIGVLDVSGFALANAFELNYGKIPGQTISLLNFGAGVTNCVVIHHGEVIFSRDIPFGGSNYTMEIHREMGVTLPEAEALKLSAVTGTEVPEQVHSIISAVNSMMIDEVRNSFDFFTASSAGFAINNCYFTGGAAGVPNLIPQISQATGIPFEPLDPFQRIKPGKGVSPGYMQQIAPFAAVAIGLGLRKVND